MRKHTITIPVPEVGKAVKGLKNRTTAAARNVRRAVAESRGASKLYRMDNEELTAMLQANLVFLAGQDPQDPRVAAAYDLVDEITKVHEGDETRRRRMTQMSHLFDMNQLIADLVITQRETRLAERAKFRAHPHGEIVVWVDRTPDEDDLVDAEA